VTRAYLNLTFALGERVSHKKAQYSGRRHNHELSEREPVCSVEKITDCRFLDSVRVKLFLRWQEDVWRVKVQLYHSWTLHWMDISTQLHAPVTLPRNPLEKRLGEPQSLSGRCEMKTSLHSLPGIKHQPSNPQPIAIPIELSWLSLWCWFLLSCYFSNNSHIRYTRLLGEPFVPKYFILLSAFAFFLIFFDVLTCHSFYEM
jgi:hypothetical protein